MAINDKIKEFALKAVGCTYVYGATGQACTPAYRKARMEQYPGSANAIKKNCPVLSGKADRCDGCKYHGKKAYDCAQLTRLAAKEAGLTLPSGASSQWNKADWSKKGTIDTLPKNTVCFLYLERASSNPMGHTGVYLGDGTAIDARGHGPGVVHKALSDVGWTHWGLLKGQEFTENENVNQERNDTMQYTVTGTRLALRKGMSKNASLITRMNTGVVVEGVKIDDDWAKVTYNGVTGFSMLKYLCAVEPETPEDAESKDELTDSEKIDILWNWAKKQGM